MKLKESFIREKPSSEQKSARRNKSRFARLTSHICKVNKGEGGVGGWGGGLVCLFNAFTTELRSVIVIML